jgi:hypothetical protein
MGSGIFFAAQLDRLNRVERLEDFSISVQAVSTAIRRSEPRVDRAICLSGKSLAARPPSVPDEWRR